MAHFSLHQPSSTKAPQSSSVSSLHHSGSTTMIRSSVEYQIDQRLYQLYENLRACNPSVLIMVNALNVVILHWGLLLRLVVILSVLLKKP